MIRISKNAEDTKEIARAVLETLSTSDRAAVVALQGELGAGKTNFAQEIGRQIGVSENMQSPTFVIIKSYAIDWKGFKKMTHIDAYRLEREEELLHLGWEELIKDPENIVVIEWPENVSGIIPLFAKRVSLKFVDENTREIFYEDDLLIS